METGGQCDELKIESNQGAELLTKIVSETVLKTAGGAKLGDELVQAYRQKYHVE